jgi:hypothetical protein
MANHALPAYDPELIHALARLFAEAALDELINEMAADVQSSVSKPIHANAAVPRPRKPRRSEGLDEREHTPTFTLP